MNWALCAKSEPFEKYLLYSTHLIIRKYQVPIVGKGYASEVKLSSLQSQGLPMGGLKLTSLMIFNFEPHCHFPGDKEMTCHGKQEIEVLGWPSASIVWPGASILKPT